MRFCKKCVMPDTRPGIRFGDDGVCQACNAEEQKNKTDWDARWKELEALCDKHRGKYGKGNWDCIIAVSGGKDSHRQVHVIKEQLGMNPLLVSVEDNFTMTEAGKHNLQNISESFGCHLITIKPNKRVQKQLAKICFEKWGKPTWFVDRLIYTFPLHMAIKFKLPLVIYGENISYEYGGIDSEETPSALAQVENGVASDIPWSELLSDDVTEKDLYLCKAPEMNNDFQLDPVYLSYFIRWNSYENYLVAKSLGFKDIKHEWQREHTPEWFDQIDTMGYLVHAWMKYPKFGHATATDYASKFVRYGLMSREEAVLVVKRFDHQVDQKAVDDFCNFTGYTLREFYEIVDKFYNTELFTKDKFGQWVLKQPVWDCRK
ncbi:N-acetyl sugar amidotransferase [Halodesulfovibrio marinisediminis]|uniref:N-acetyl sugar amidotransferase n=1 Tax=Halodesulfovibrio marinisediminis DSM 17456 TaxID=1121457 RepID=A0A1N6FTC7_9BACT|nr:N-acetyl sugar amidotransferase [Halodesulfovibrio marinisediminis]SIN98467.1 N-acetyl sugar amidotransferase [Halodesulfovibrio marinisediminis DSM 17456]